MQALKPLLTVEQVKEIVAGEFAKANLQSVSIQVIPHEVVHNGSLKPYTICGSYANVRPDGFGGLDRLGFGECKYDKEANRIDDTTSSTPSSRRFKEVTEVIFSVSNINSISRAHHADPLEELEVYASFAADDVLWSKRSN